MNIMKYYLIHKKDTGELYAYSSDKKEIKRFMKFRNTSKFIKSSGEFALEDRKHIAAHHSQRRIREYTFYLQGVKINIPLTHDEINIINQICIADDTYLTSLATIDPCIFKKKIMEYLLSIHYTRYWMRWRHGVDILEDYTEESLAFRKFMSQFGEYMNLIKIKKEAIKNLENMEEKKDE